MQGRHEDNTAELSLPGHVQDHSLYRAYPGTGTSWSPTSLASPVATTLSSSSTSGIGTAFVEKFMHAFITVLACLSLLAP